MGINYQKKLAEKIINKLGRAATIESLPGQEFTAIFKRSLMHLDNASRAHDTVHLISFIKPLPVPSMRKEVITDTDTGDQFVLGSPGTDNGYIIQFEATLK